MVLPADVASSPERLEQTPGHPDVLPMAGHLAWCHGRSEEARDDFHGSTEVDPLRATGYEGVALALSGLGRHSEAVVEAMRMLLGIAHARPDAEAQLARFLLAVGDTEQALEVAGAEPNPAYRSCALAIVHHARGRRAEPNAALEERILDHASELACMIAEVHAERGEIDAAFDWLERAYAKRDGWLADARSTRSLRPLHGDPRWAPFMAKLGLAA